MSCALPRAQSVPGPPGGLVSRKRREPSRDSLGKQSSHLCEWPGSQCWCQSQDRGEPTPPASPPCPLAIWLPGAGSLRPGVRYQTFTSSLAASGLARQIGMTCLCAHLVYSLTPVAGVWWTHGPTEMGGSRGCWEQSSDCPLQQPLG